MSSHEKRPAYEPALRLLRPTGYDPAMHRPAATIAGVALLALRVVVGVVTLLGVWLRPGDVVDLTVDGASLGLTISLLVVAGVLVVDAALAALIWAGLNWPRVVVMFGSVLSISSAFVGWWSEGQEITITRSLAGVALDVLVLLALSSRNAAAYARRKKSR